MSGVSISTLELQSFFNNVELDFRSVARTTPLADLMPIVVTPCFTAFKAYSIWTNLPLVVRIEGNVGC